MNKRIAIGVLVIIMVTVLVSGCTISQPSAKTSQTNQPLQKITIAEYGEVFIYAPLYVAQEKGFFKEQGLEATIVPTGGDEKTFAALLSGNAQFGVADPTFAVISGEKGQPGKVVASVVSGVPLWGIATDQNIPLITNPEQLSNYRVATYTAPSTSYTLQKQMFENGGLKPNIKEMAYGSLLAGLEANQADIALELEPTVSIAVKNGGHIVYALSDYFPDFALTGLTVLPDYMEKNPETVQKVVNALQKACDYIRNNPKQAAEIMAKKFPEADQSISENAINNMVKANVIPQSVVVSQSSWDAATQLRKNAGEIKGMAAYEDYVVTSFAKNSK